MGGITNGMANAIPNLASPAWLLLLLALPLLAWAHHRRSSLGALTYSRLPAGPGKSGRRTRGAWRRCVAHSRCRCRAARIGGGHAAWRARWRPGPLTSACRMR